MSQTPTIFVRGTVHKPHLIAQFSYSSRYAKRPQMKLADFVKELPDRKWDPSAKLWTITGVGPEPERLLTEAGFDIEWDEDEFAHIDSLDELTTPRAKLADNGGGVYIRPRLLGRKIISDIIGHGAVWEAKTARFWVPLGEIAPVADRLDFLGDDILDAIDERTSPLIVPKGADDFPLDQLAQAVSADEVDDFADVSENFGDVPDWYGLDLFEYQRLGAIAAWGGFRMICDEPGLGKCVDAATQIETQSGIQRIGDLWADRDHRAYPDPEEPSGDLIDLADGEVVVSSLNESSSRPESVSASHIFRQRYAGTMRTIVTSTGREISCTPAHRLWTQDGWKRSDEIAPGDFVALNVSQAVTWDSVVEVGTYNFDGYVYDLCVPGNHSYTAEGIFSHNTRTAMAAAAMHAPKRVLISSPPVGVTHWVREATTSRLAWAAELSSGEMGVEPGELDVEGGPFLASARDERFEGRVVDIRSGRKIPELPERGIVVVADSFLSNKPELQAKLAEWAPDVFIDDEIHRHANITTHRTKSTISVSSGATYSYGITGTPVMRSPEQIPSQLLITDTLDHFGGSVGEFLEEYCRLTKFGWMPRKKKSKELGRILGNHVWVRRTKAKAQPQLPKRARRVEWLDVPLKDYRAATAETVEKMHELIERFIDKNGRLPRASEMRLVVPDMQRFTSPLRRAAGFAKIPDAFEWGTEHLEATGRADDGGYDRPLVMWVWHNDVAEELTEQLSKFDSEVIYGATNSKKRDDIVDRFQSGEVGVLVASISAANVAITLTRSCDALFVESDWTPSNVSQAEDRINRIGQTRPVTITALSAVGTVDERMHGSQIETSEVLDAIMPGGNNLVSGAVEDHDEDPMLRLGELVQQMYENALKKWDAVTLERKK